MSKMTTATIGWILIITSILPVCSGQCSDGRDGPSCRRRNVALNRETNQSSNYMYMDTKFPSDSAVDGKTGHDLYSTPCTHTLAGLSQYWTVTLDKSYWIYRFTIYNRNEGCGPEGQCGARLNGFTLSVRNSAGAYTTCYQDSTTSANGPGDVISQQCTSPVLGNMVKISLSSGRPLTLCEVLLYVCEDGWYGEMCDRQCVTTTACHRCDNTGTRCAECVPGRYGEHCESRCGNCYNNRRCAKQTGECPEVDGERCQAGYMGVPCLSPCTNGRWGADCAEPCGNCYNGNVCNKTSGECSVTEGDPRCAPGFEDTDKTCRTPCADGRWGAGCPESCANCYNGDVCNKTSGECPVTEGNPRCPTGYEDTDKTCRTPCADGRWGAGCSGSCGNCYNGNVCNKRSGECFLSEGNPRCAAGFENTDKTCRTPCADGRWGAGCSKSCGNCYNRNVCNKTSGECPVSEGNPRCSASFEDTDKTCRTPCADGRWGADCPASCGNCYNGNVCNKRSGECPVTEGNQRCSAGYKDTDKTCRTPCADRTWGDNCSRNCTQNCVADGCDAITGTCLSGCQPGFTGDRCETACRSYRWGPSCGETCGQCHGGAVCDGVTGECPPGSPRCTTGYTEPHCTPCDAGKWGSNCVFTCSENCVVLTCNVTTGVCEGGCNPGYTGGRCNTVAAVVIDYTGVIIGCVSAVVVTALIITFVRRRRSGSSQEAATSNRNNGSTQEVPQPEVPSGRDSDPNTYYNVTAMEENPHDGVTEKEYDMIRLSRLDTDTHNANLN